MVAKISRCTVVSLRKPTVIAGCSKFCGHVHCSICRAQYKEWLATYESLGEGEPPHMVVPRSSQLIHEDTEYGLYTVSVFKKVIDEYKLHAREKK